MTIDELTRRAFIWAEQDRDAMYHAWPVGSKERRRAKSERDQLRRYRLKRWGRTQLESALAGAVEVSIGRVLNSTVQKEREST